MAHIIFKASTLIFILRFQYLLTLSLGLMVRNQMEQSEQLSTVVHLSGNDGELLEDKKQLRGRFIRAYRR